jgi:hypothetical protein
LQSNEVVLIQSPPNVLMVPSNDTFYCYYPHPLMLAPPSSSPLNSPPTVPQNYIPNYSQAFTERV